jgi:hypothetical protein
MTSESIQNVRVADGLHDTDQTLRHTLAATLRGATLPADRTALLSYASAQPVTDDIREVLEALPPDIEFGTVRDIWDTYNSATTS